MVGWLGPRADLNAVENRKEIFLPHWELNPNSSVPLPIAWTLQVTLLLIRI
jgi:hypothetical protein